MYEIVALPAVKAETRPEAEPTEATVGLVLVQVPPGVLLVRFSVPPTHMFEMAVGAITAGLAFTYINAVT
jgi:hypothetical protein